MDSDAQFQRTRDATALLGSHVLCGWLSWPALERARVSAKYNNNVALATRRLFFFFDFTDLPLQSRKSDTKYDGGLSQRSWVVAGE